MGSCIGQQRHEARPCLVGRAVVHGETAAGRSCRKAGTHSCRASCAPGGSRQVGGRLCGAGQPGNPPPEAQGERHVLLPGLQGGTSFPGPAGLRRARGLPGTQLSSARACLGAFLFLICEVQVTSPMLLVSGVHPSGCTFLGLLSGDRSECSNICHCTVITKLTGDGPSEAPGPSAWSPCAGSGPWHPIQTFKVTSPLPGASAAVAPVSAGHLGRRSPQGGQVTWRAVQGLP